MRFSTIVISLTSLVLGTNAVLDLGYTRAWDLTIGGRGRWRGVIDVQLENGQMYIGNTTNKPPNPNPSLRYEIVGMRNLAGEIISAAKLVGYPDYTTPDQGLYMWQSEAGFVYGPLSESPVYLKSWWFTPGPANNRQPRLTLDGNSTGKALWNESKLRWDFFIGSGIPADRVQDMIDIDLTVTEYCGPGVNDYCG